MVEIRPSMMIVMIGMMLAFTVVPINAEESHEPAAALTVVPDNAEEPHEPAAAFTFVPLPAEVPGEPALAFTIVPAHAEDPDGPALAFKAVPGHTEKPHVPDLAFTIVPINAEDPDGPMLAFKVLPGNTEKPHVPDAEFAKMEWGYDGSHGPAHWGKLGPAFALCDTGMAQSPIDMVKTHRLDLDEIGFSYGDAPFRVANNGHTLQEAVPLSETFESRYPQHGQTVTVKSRDPQHGQPMRLFDKDSTIIFDGDLYLLEQFHFHSPSEHTVFHKHFAIEMHLVHHNAQNEAAVVAVFMREGKHHPVFQQFLEHAPSKVGDVVDDHKQTLNPMDLLPKSHTYYRYFGSFTTPPCHEGVIWAIMHDPIEVSAEQIRQFRSILGGTNIRPTQPVHNRFVLESSSVTFASQGGK